MLSATRALLWSAAGFGWAMLIASDAPFASTGGYCSTRGVPSPAFLFAQLRALWFADAATTVVLPWLLMLIAMLPPLLLQPAAHVVSAVPARRHTALLAFLSSYASAWLAATPLLILFTMLLAGLFPTHVWSTAIVALAIALAWQATALRRRCLARCLTLPQLDGHTACTRYGIATGAACVGVCWPWMLAAQLVPGDLHMPAMAISALIMFRERRALSGHDIPMAGTR